VSLDNMKSEYFHPWLI